jgi:hypothetical protein
MLSKPAVDVSIGDIVPKVGKITRIIQDWDGITLCADDAGRTLTCEPNALVQVETGEQARDQVVRAIDTRGTGGSCTP